jgi:hypothetical protein
MKRDLSKTLRQALIAGSALAAGMFAGTAMADDAAGGLRNHTIGYVLTDRHWAVYTTPDKKECPEGMNDGPREQFKILFPDDGTKRKLVDTQLAREGEIWHPHTTPEPYAFKQPKSTVSIGLNLDGKVGPNDFTSPEGEKGVDNQLYRVLGCVAHFRGPDGSLYFFGNKFAQATNYDRVLIELTNVDNLTNSDNVTVTTYRGLDYLMPDAGGNEYTSGGTERVDTRFGKKFVSRFHGKIVNGVLTTDAQDMYFPASMTFADVSVEYLRAAQLRLKLTPTSATGLIGAYADVEHFYRTLIKSWSTHHQSYGQSSAPSIYRALRQLADAYPEPKTGANTAISGALEVKFTQAFIEHPGEKVAATAHGGQPAAQH